MNSTEAKELNERISGNYIVYMGQEDDIPEFPQYIYNCEFACLNHKEGSGPFFSLTAIPGQEGYHVRMRSVKVIPSDCKSFSKFPKFLIPLVKMMGAKEILSKSKP